MTAVLTPDSDQNFTDWMTQVDKILSAKIGLSSLDLSDKNYRDYFDEKYSPTGAVRELFGTNPEDMMLEELFG
tara:strand:- start:263 stop:481 length:219 start_codon:yes stop_codon:yes gene_type:complete